MSLPFVPPAGPQPLLPKNAPAPRQFSRLLDALVILDVERSCRITDLAARVGLEAGRMRELLSTFMVAGADALGPDAPFNLTFGTRSGPLGADPEDDDAQDDADTVYLSSLREPGEWLLADVGRRPVMVRDVARALLAATLLVEGGQLPPEQHAGVQALAGKLAAAMSASVDAFAADTTSRLRLAVRERRRVRFRYLHPWTGESQVVEVEPYDVRRRRERLVLDAGPSLTTYDVGGLSELELVGEPQAYEVPGLPGAEDADVAVEVVLRVRPGSSQERWLRGGWGATVVHTDDEKADLRVELDGDAADPGVAQRLGVLLLQLGPPVTVVSPTSLVSAAVPVARRLVEVHGGQSPLRTP